MGLDHQAAEKLAGGNSSINMLNLTQFRSTYGKLQAHANTILSFRRDSPTAHAMNKDGTGKNETTPDDAEYMRSEFLSAFMEIVRVLGSLPCTGRPAEPPGHQGGRLRGTQGVPASPVARERPPRPCSVKQAESLTERLEIADESIAVGSLAPSHELPIVPGDAQQHAGDVRGNRPAALL